MRAAKSGNHATVEKLLMKGADVNTKEIDYVSSLWGVWGVCCDINYNVNSFSGPH